MSLSLKDQHVCSLYVSGAIFLDEASELVGVVSFCVRMRYVEVVHQRAFMLFLKADKRINCATNVHLSLVLSVSNRSDFLSEIPCVMVYGVMSQHNKKTEIVVVMG